MMLRATHEVDGAMGRAFAYAAFGRVFPGSGARLKRSLNASEDD